MAKEPQQLSFDFPAPGETRAKFLDCNEIFRRADQAMLAELVEDRRFEMKTALVQAATVGEYVSMFANTTPDGGLIAIGMADDGALKGCSHVSQDHLNDLERAPDVYCPDAKYDFRRIRVTNTRGKEDWVLIFHVYYHQSKLVETVKGDAYTRRGQSKVKLTDDEKREIRYAKGEVELEQEPCNLKYPVDFDLDLVNQFCSAFKVSRDLITDRNNEDILELRKLGRQTVDGFVPNLACALLFAKESRQIVPGARIRFLRYEGEEEGTGDRYNAVKDIWIEGPIPKVIAKAEMVVESQLREFSRLGKDSKFYTAQEYPKEAWYEVIVNACVHRSYGLKNMPIFVKMFDDRLVVESPGGFPPLVTPENIYDIHQPRNPYLMEALYYLNFVKCAHEGTRRIRDTMRSMRLPAPEFRQEDIHGTQVRVTLRNNVAHRKVYIDADAAKIVGVTISRSLTEHEKRVINFAAENHSVNVSQTQRLTGKSWPAAKTLLMGLEDKGILEHVIREELDRDPKAHFVLSRPKDAITGKEH